MKKYVEHASHLHIWKVSWATRESPDVFWTKGGRLGPPASHVTFFGPKEISKSPPLVMWPFFGPQDVSWGPPWVAWRFLDQRRSVGAPLTHITFFFGSGSSVEPPWVTLRFFGSRRSVGAPLEWLKMIIVSSNPNWNENTQKFTRLNCILTQPLPSYGSNKLYIVKAFTTLWRRWWRRHSVLLCTHCIVHTYNK